MNLVILQESEMRKKRSTEVLWTLDLNLMSLYLFKAASSESWKIVTYYCHNREVASLCANEPLCLKVKLHFVKALKHVMQLAADFLKLFSFISAMWQIRQTLTRDSVNRGYDFEE